MNKLERTCVPISERFLIVERKGNTKNKFTINPIDGRCSLKVTDYVSDDAYDILHNMAKHIMNSEVPSITLRGRFKHYQDQWRIQLISELNDVKISFSEDDLTKEVSLLEFCKFIKPGLF